MFNAAISTTLQLAGFVNTRYCTLVNTSLIPMTFNLRVPADGWASEEMHSRDNSLIDSNLSDVGSTSMPSPREFDISPSTGTIAPQGELDVKVTRMCFLQNILCYMSYSLEIVDERPTICSVGDLHQGWIHTGFLCLTEIGRIFRMTQKPSGMGTFRG